MPKERGFQTLKKNSFTSAVTAAINSTSFSQLLVASARADKVPGSDSQPWTLLVNYLFKKYPIENTDWTNDELQTFITGND